MASSDVERLEQEVAELRAVVADLQQKLMDAQKMSAVGTLASSITHEFNNILTTIINYAKMGVRHRNDETRDKALDKILAAGHRASKITTGMLSYSRSRGDRREVMSLVQLVEDVLVLVEKDLQIHRIRLETDFIGDPSSEVNPSQIQQVLLNLIINARQAMEPGDSLFIGVRANPETKTADIVVRDSGAGIPPEKLPNIFEAFYSTKSADAQGQGGTGLGLALCKDVVESHKGRIRVESVIGRGTTFTLKLPLADAARALREATSGSPIQKAG
ncbi:MAG: sensor histidine kinase [Planctomycetota bacterium]|nr:MAG: sensor histidine kinase [Planctomycetota bacterium]REJ90528.1 MAG: sensor histidine kinase [Planctomycetota bacterium]REK24151.1 MAG: sensor histidine kinase [Planctomycetota bacterium]REK38391.1 MAG: sensor histidine kinase [Planctomycetota bacterium]